MDYHLSIEGERSGPLSQFTLIDRIREGKLKGDELVWHLGLADWVKLRELDELSSYWPISEEQKAKAEEARTVARAEGSILVVSLPNGRAEGILPRAEQIPGETHHPGDRIRSMVLEVRDLGHQVKIEALLAGHGEATTKHRLCSWGHRTTAGASPDRVRKVDP